MNAYLKPEIARALLAQSRAFTQAKRKEREQAAQFDKALEQFKRIGFSNTAAGELAQIHVYGVQG